VAKPVSGGAVSGTGAAAEAAAEGEGEVEAICGEDLILRWGFGER
jgi:hypothetical protein